MPLTPMIRANITLEGMQAQIVHAFSDADFAGMSEAAMASAIESFDLEAEIRRHVATALRDKVARLSSGPIANLFRDKEFQRKFRQLLIDSLADHLDFLKANPEVDF